jgi:hypothetical protein
MKNFEKGVDKQKKIVYNTRVPKTAGSRKSESHPAEEENLSDISYP